MTERDPHLMQIGRFSDTTRLSVKALRRYDEIGLLVPEHVDRSSGYRYYGPSQVARAEAIRLLRSVDMPLDEIGRVLNSAPELRDRLMATHLERLQGRLVSQKLMLAAFSDMASGRRPLMPYEVTEKQTADQHVAALTRHVDAGGVGAAVATGFGEVVADLQRAGLAPSGAPFLIMHDVIDEETEGDIEICIPVTGEFAASAPVESKVISGGSAATTIHRGAYEEVAPAYHAISSWMANEGWAPAGPPREIYLNDPTEVSVAEQLTEVQWPIRRDSAG